MIPYIYKKLVLFGLTVAVLLVATSIGEACPTCKASLADDAGHAGMIRGYFWSIIFMISAVFLTFGGICSYFYVLVKRAQQQQQVADLTRPNLADAVV